MQAARQPYPSLSLVRPSIRFLVVKRAIDIVCALVLLVLLLPVLILCALAIRLDSAGPMLFRQQRVGEGGRTFTLLKFRSMHANADARKHQEFAAKFIAGRPVESHKSAYGDVYKLVNDARITRVGKWLRRTSLDELPQIWNVVRGDMSLVGPRPPLPYEVEHYQPSDLRRLDAKPGITGLWQVSGRSRTTFAQMVQLDVHYIENRSLVLDLWIMLRTIPVVFGRSEGY